MTNISTDQAGQHQIVPLSDGRHVLGTIQIRAIKCGKPNCRSCPHRYYAYLHYHDGKKTINKYIGKAIPRKEPGDDRAV